MVNTKVNSSERNSFNKVLIFVFMFFFNETFELKRLYPNFVD